MWAYAATKRQNFTKYGKNRKPLDFTMFAVVEYTSAAIGGRMQDLQGPGVRSRSSGGHRKRSFRNTAGRSQ